jgi:hypothetical protein
LAEPLGALRQWLQLEHAPELQLEQAVDEEVWRSTPDIPNVDGSLSISLDPQPGQLTVALVEKTSFSKRSSQFVQLYSKTGMSSPSVQFAAPYLSTSADSMLHCLSMPLGNSLQAVVVSPTAGSLWRLRADLLEAGLGTDSRVWSLLEEFHGFLDHVSTGASSRDHSQLASALDISAISGVILERLAEQGEADEQALRLMSGMLSEGLMALATRQHVKAWAGEMDAVFRSAAWSLYEKLWRWTQKRTPGLPAAGRRRLLDELLSPAMSPDASDLHKAALIGRLFQLLILSALTEDLPELDITTEVRK